MEMQFDRPPVVLFGSPSDERRVSVASAQFLARSLSVRLWFWAPDDRVIEVSHEALAGHRDPFTTDFSPAGIRSWPHLDAGLAALSPERDVVVLGVHGSQGEDGDLQRRLEARGLAFTGSDSHASALAFNKSEALATAAAHGLRIAAGRVLVAADADRARALVDDAWAALGPMVVKAEAGGSSLRLSFVRSPDERARAAALLAQHAGVRFRAEQIIEGREFTVGVIEHDGAELALPCTEVIMRAGRSFDYDGKYLGAGSQEITPAEIADELRDQLQQAALTAHRALGCAGYTRSDFIVDAHGPVYLETNTLPGLTARSFIPQQLEAAGIAFEHFLHEQIALAVAHRDARAARSAATNR